MDDKHINFLHKEMSPMEPPKQKWKKRWVLLFLTLLLIFLIAGYVSANKDKFLNPLEYDPITLEPKKPEGFLKKLSYIVFRKDVKLEGQYHDRINILLLGMGGPGHDGPYLTDTIMIVSIKPSTNEVALISIPRDLGVDIPDYGVQKINHANHFGEQKKEHWGGAFTTEVISDLFDIDIPYYIRVDFQAFEEIINEVGGVRVTVDRTFTDYMYPAANDLYQTVSFNAGPQTMDGRTSLMFVRSRHGGNGEGSDFARAARQQKIILALKEKILSFNTLTNPVKIKKIMDALERHMTTNMEFDEILGFVRIAKNLDTHNIKTLVLDNGPQGYLVNGTGTDGAYYLFPRTGNFDNINQAIKHIYESDPLELEPEPEYDNTPVQVEPEHDDAIIEIQNGTWRAGLATRFKQRLIDKNFLVEDIGNTDPEYKPILQSGIYDITHTSTETTLSALKDELHISIRTNIPQGAWQTASSTDILIILGDDIIE